MAFDDLDEEEGSLPTPGESMEVMIVRLREAMKEEPTRRRNAPRKKKFSRERSPASLRIDERIVELHGDGKQSREISAIKIAETMLHVSLSALNSRIHRLQNEGRIARRYVADPSSPRPGRPSKHSPRSNSNYSAGPGAERGDPLEGEGIARIKHVLKNRITVDRHHQLHLDGHSVSIIEAAKAAGLSRAGA